MACVDDDAEYEVSCLFVVATYSEFVIVIRLVVVDVSGFRSEFFSLVKI